MLATAAETETHKLQKEQGKEWSLEHPHCSCRKAKRCSFPFFSITHCHSQSLMQKTDPWLDTTQYTTWNSLGMQCNKQHNQTITQQWTLPGTTSRIFLFAYLSYRWWMLLNAYMTALTNLHSQPQEAKILLTSRPSGATAGAVRAWLQNWFWGLLLPHIQYTATVTAGGLLASRPPSGPAAGTISACQQNCFSGLVLPC